MTLGRQILAVVLLVSVLIFSGTFFIALHNTRAYLVTQLESHAQDAATSLGLSLSPHMATGDTAMMESMIDAIFDPGYYREVTLVGIDGKPLLGRSQEVKVEGVPPWFVERVPLETPTAEAVVMAGWRQGGWIRVTSHPGYAYAQIWSSARDTLGWSLGSLALAVVALGALLRLVLRPLVAVERQALAVADREFPVLDRLPRTRELRRVVVAMNRMSQKMQQALAEQTAIAERLRAEAYTDAVTGVGNRRGFQTRMDQLTRTVDAPGYGALMLVRLGQLDRVNRLHGHAAGDDLLRAAATRLEAVLGEGYGPGLARLQGAEFGAVLPGATAGEASSLAQQVVDELGTLAPPPAHDALTVHVGVGYAAAGDPAGELLWRADTALRAAENAAASGWRAYPEPGKGPPYPVQGAEAWRQLLGQALDGRSIGLVTLPVRGCRDRELLHLEVLARLPVPGHEPLPAALFLPMAERLGLGPALDRLVLEQVLQRLAEAPGGLPPLAVNLCPSSLRDAGLADWLEARLAAAPGVGARIIFELSEYGATRALDAWRQLIQRLAPLGARFSVDWFGVGSSMLRHLQGLKLDYLKLDPGLARRVTRERDEQFFVKVVSDIAHALDIQVVATGVETEAEWQGLCALGVDGAEGRHVDEPLAWLP